MRFESLWIQVYLLVAVLGYLTVFFSFSIFLRFKGVFQRIFVLCFLIAEWFLLMALPSFIVPSYGFWFTTNSLHLLPWVPEPMLCQQHWWLDPSLFSHYFPLLRFPSKKSLAYIPFLGVLGADFQSSLPKDSKCSFLDPPFWLLHLLSFSLNG